MPPKTFKANFFHDNGCAIFDADGSVEIVSSGKWTAEELAAAATISDLLNRLRKGTLMPSNNKVQQKVVDDLATIVKLEWLRSGSLKLHGDLGKSSYPYRRVDTIDGALAEHRTFICERKLYLLLPKKRQVFENAEVAGDDE